MAGGAEDGVEFGSTAGVEGDVASGADHGVGVDEPVSARVGESRATGEAVDETDFGGIDIFVEARAWKGKLGLNGESEFGGQGFVGVQDFAGEFGFFGVGIGPLHDVVVLGANDGEAVEIAFADEGFDVGDVVGGELGGEFNDDAAMLEFACRGVLGIELRAPIGGSGGSEDVSHDRSRADWWHRRKRACGKRDAMNANVRRKYF